MAQVQAANRRLDKLVSHLTSRKDTFTYTDPLSVTNPHGASLLKTIVPSDRYCEDDETRSQHGRQAIAKAIESRPQAVIFPKTTEEVSKIVRVCNEFSIPLISYSGGTSLENHVKINDSRGGLTLSFKRMKRVLAVHPADMQVVVEPGVNWHDLNEKTLIPKHNLFIGVDPALSACIGGMVGTCCSGPMAFRYGTMANQVISMTIVTCPEGKVVRTGQRAPKSVAGLNLNGLFVGSEGILGIVTEICLKLRAYPSQIDVATVVFDNLAQVAHVTGEVIKSPVRSHLMAFELLDDRMVNALINFSPRAMKKAALVRDKHLVMMKIGDATSADVDELKRIVGKHNPTHEIQFSTDEKSRKRLWMARKTAFHAVRAITPSNKLVITDVAVPVSKLPILLTRSREAIESTSLDGPILAHIGDGNFHCNLSFNANSESETKEAKELVKFIVDLALELEGTCTAEHGIGENKIDYLPREFGSEAVELMKRLKRCLDPNNVLNPGKVLRMDRR